tara:strand:+ start:349 stop:825 length:477 start_codon:yes stop_codon:yes gene_type:complete
VDERSQTLGDSDTSSQSLSDDSTLAVAEVGAKLDSTLSPIRDRRHSYPRLWGAWDNAEWSPCRSRFIKSLTASPERSLECEHPRGCSCCAGPVCAADVALGWVDGAADCPGAPARRVESPHGGNRLSGEQPDSPLALVSSRSHGEIEPRRLFEETSES